MIRHCVMLRLRADAERRELSRVVDGLKALVTDLEGCSGFGFGQNLDFEGTSQDVDAGFTFDAQDAATLATYADHPTHRALGARLVALCAGGTAGITVFDLDIAA